MTWAAPNKPIRIVLLDDHAVVRHGLSARLAEEADFLIVGMYATSKEMLMSTEAHGVDLFLIDYALGEHDIDGLNLIRALKIRFPKSWVLVSSSHDNPATVALALRAGAKGFVGKGQELSELVQAIRVVVQGRTYLSQMMAAELSSASSRGLADIDATVSNRDSLTKHKDLSPREREVLRCCLDGLTVTQIATKFARSVKTISGQKQAAFRKLGIRNDSELFKIQSQLKDI